MSEPDSRLEHSCGGFFDAYGVCSECGGELNAVGKFFNRRAWGRRWLAREIPGWVVLLVGVVGFFALFGAPVLIAVFLIEALNFDPAVGGILGAVGWIGFLIWLDTRSK